MSVPGGRPRAARAHANRRRAAPRATQMSIGRSRDDIVVGRECGSFNKSRWTASCSTDGTMDYVTPQDTIDDARALARRKAALPAGQLLLRGALAGGILAYATSFALGITAQGLPPIVGAICFPAGFVVLVLLGLELATGNFALLPIAWLSGEMRASAVARNWTWVYLGNLLGSVAYAGLFALAITAFGTSNGAALGDQLRKVAQAK